MTRRSFSLMEGMVVALAVAALAAVGWPALSPARPGVEDRARTVCVSQIRQLATAVQMFVQDNASRYPGVTWHTAVEDYVGARALLRCPADDAPLRDPISYGYSSLLVRADGTGCNEAQIKAPTDVGCVADAAPTRAWADGGGLIGGDALGKSVALLPTPRHAGIIIGFCDGHAKYYPGVPINTRDLTSGPGRALYQALNLGLIQNYGGGLSKMPVAVTKDTVVIGGDYAGLPLVFAAAEAWAANGGRWYSRGFVGANHLTDWQKAKDAGRYVWLDASGAETGTPVAKDALVVIVAKACRIPAIGNAGAVTAEALVRLFAQGFAHDAVQVYSYHPVNGNHAYLAGKLRAWGAVKGAEISAQAVISRDDCELVERVAADPYGIGYCSAAMADVDRVTILDLRIGDTIHSYPSSNPAARRVVPWRAADCRYPLLRTLRVRTAADGAALANIITTPEFQQGPLFKTGYFAP